jgi:hypothetical protein
MRTEITNPNSLAPQPRTLPSDVLAKLVREPVAIWEIRIPFRAGISNNASHPSRSFGSTASGIVCRGDGARPRGPDRA